MDKMHDKTAKVFDDIRKKKNMSPKSFNTDFNNKNLDNIARSSFKCCMFCQKVFIDSRFLMKHLLRRHSDELILFYRTHTSHESNGSTSEFQRLIDILQKEFSNLKKEFFSAKIVVDETLEADCCKENQTVIEKKPIDTLSNNQSTNVVLYDEFKELKDKMFDVEKDIQNLNDKFAELDNVLRNDVVTKQDLSEKLILTEEKIMQAQRSQFIELKQVLLNDLKSLLFNQQEENRNEWKSSLLELRQEIKRLDYAIDKVRQQFICTDSLKEEIKKELVPHIIPYISSKKCEENKRKSLLHKRKLSVNKSYQALSQKQLSNPENFRYSSSNLKKHSETTLKNADDIAIIVADKLSKFSIPPNTSKVSSTEYNKILKSLNVEKMQQLDKYSNFFEIYNDINIKADQIAHNELKHKKHGKINNFKSSSSSKNSLNHSTSFENNLHEQSNKSKYRKERNISFSKPLTSSRNSLNHSMSFEDSSIYEQFPTVQKENKSLTCSKILPSDSKAVFRKKSSSFLQNKNLTLNEGASGDSPSSFSNKQSVLANQAQINPVKDFETFAPEDIQNCKNLNATYIKCSSSDIEHPSYKRKLRSSAPMEQRNFKSALHNNSVKFKETSVVESYDKPSEFEDRSKDDFDDVSSLEAVSLSEDENSYAAK